MIVYVDTSVLVPLLIEEPSSARCGELWDGADTVTATRLAYVESVAALAHGARLGRISACMAGEARAVLDDLWTAVDVIEIDAELMRIAGDLALAHGLRGYDATRCAAAMAVNDDQLVAATGDQRLLAAWAAEGVATWNANV